MSVLAIIICSIIIFGSVCWGGNISILDRGRLEKIVVKKKAEKKAGHDVGKPLDSFKTTRKETVQKTNATIK